MGGGVPKGGIGIQIIAFCRRDANQQHGLWYFPRKVKRELFFLFRDYGVAECTGPKVRTPCSTGGHLP